MVRTATRPPANGARRRLWSGGKGLLTAIAGLGIPILVIYALIQMAVVRPAETPDPPSVEGVTPATEGADGIRLVGGIGGRWTVVPGEESWIGYRIEERFARLPGPTEGAGRTHDVEATMTIEDVTVTDAEVTGDLRTLESGDWRRDREIQLRWLEAERYPDVIFRLTEPITLGRLPEPGETLEAVAVGELTIREIARPVEVPIEARWDGERAVVAGTARVTLADYGIETPRVLSYVEAAPEADIELQLTFART
jgi:polyisoprenoid-binding protein YceI